MLLKRLRFSLVNTFLITPLAYAWLALGPSSWGQAGGLAWTNEFGDFSYEDNTGAIAADGTAVYAVGTVSDGSGNWDWLLTALSNTNGATLWQSQFGTTNRLEDANAMMVWGRRLFVVGYEDNGLDSASDWITCAYDTRTGVMLWTNRFANTNGFDVPFAVAVADTRVYSVGQASSGFAVEACDARTGALLWRDSVPVVTGPDQATAVATLGGKVFASGCIYAGGLHYDWLVRAYNGRSGRLLWQDRFNIAGLLDQPVAIAAGDGTLYAVGTVDDASTNGDWLVKAYDATNGRLIWQDRVDKAGGFDEATTVAVRGNLVCVAGISDVGGQGAPADYHWLVRAYDGKNGSLLWEDSSRSAGGLTAPKSIALSGTNLCVAGSVYDLQNGSDWLLRVYGATNGDLQWENQYDRSGFWDDERGMAVDPQSVYMFGLTTDAQTTIVDWMVRSYRLK
ncbi:MAG TPA: hypothetical protein VMP11_05660 [Verrucomicrobiae bacterium]|nr:hypothetical protein [Verrucomicrobiae bacterium]